jgi:integrase
MATERFRIVLAIIETKDRKTKESVKKWQARIYDQKKESQNKRVKTIIVDAPVTLVRGKGESKARAEAESKLKDLIAEGKLAKSVESDPLVKDYLLDHWKYTPGTIDEDRSVRHLQNEYCLVKKHWAPVLGDLRMSRLTRKDVINIREQWKKEGVSRATINRRMSPFKTAIKKWFDDLNIPNPIGYLKPEKAKKPKAPGVFFPQEIAKIIELKTADPRVRAATLLGLLCGLRKGEIKGLQWSDIDFENEEIIVQHNFVCNEEGIKPPKCESGRNVPYPSTIKYLFELLDSLPHRASPFVLWNDRSSTKPISDTIFNSGFPKLLETIGISPDEKKARKLHFHSTRHTFVGLSQAKGIPEFIVQQLVGHSSPEMVRKYGTRTKEVIDFTVYRDQLENKVPSAAGGDK